MMKMIRKAVTVAVLALTVTMSCIAKEQPMDEYLDCVKVGSIYVMKYKVNQGLYETVMGTNPSRYRGAENPVEMVSFYDAVKFCNKLSEMQGLTPYYSVLTFRGDITKASLEDIVKENKTANGWRLPSVAEWRKISEAITMVIDDLDIGDRQLHVSEFCSGYTKVVITNENIPEEYKIKTVTGRNHLVGFRMVRSAE